MLCVCTQAPPMGTYDCCVFRDVTVPSRFSQRKVQVSWCYWAQSEHPSHPHFSVSGVVGGVGWGGGVLRSLRLRSRGEGVSRWLLILQDEAPGPRRWERAPPLCGLAPLGGGGGSVSGPARRGPAVGRAGWSQEAGVQGRGHWRARQVLWQTHVRQPCFCSVKNVLSYNVLKERGGKKPLLICKCVIFCSSNHRTLFDWPAVM